MITSKLFDPTQKNILQFFHSNLNYKEEAGEEIQESII